MTDPARDVDEDSGVAVDGQAVAPEPREVHALNKPAGVVSTARDTQGRPTVVELVPSRRRLYPVGRLDADTHRADPADQRRRAGRPAHAPALRRGEALPRPRAAGGASRPPLYAPCARACSSTTAAPRPPALRQPAPGVLEIAIREGRKRQVRRMVEAVGHRVVALERVAFGPLGLRGLAPGKSRRLRSAEVERLRRAARPAAAGRRRG